MKKRCVNEYGQAVKELKVGAVVECDLAIFTVGHINTKPLDWLVFMDKNKPYKVKNENDPMAGCVRSGNLAVVASQLTFSELEGACEESN